MKCPYCGKKGAKVLPAMIGPERLIHTATSCCNPECTAYDPITHGYHQDMPAEAKELFEKMQRAVHDESDFDLIDIQHLKKNLPPR